LVPWHLEFKALVALDVTSKTGDLIIDDDWLHPARRL